MNAPGALLQCPKCQAELPTGGAGLEPCLACGTPLQVLAFPALFRPLASGHAGELILTDGLSGCFYHPEKRAVAHCDLCGRFLCALCDCEIKGRHFCPPCLETGQKKRSIQGLEDSRVLYGRQALVLSLLPLVITGIAAVFLAVRYRRAPSSLVAPMRWAFPAAIILGSLQILGGLALIALLVAR
jgi:hypothetical protein